MSRLLYVQLSLMMFLQFAVWGAWSPVLAARLLGPLGMTGKQTGWIYGTVYLGCIVSPLIAGQVADRWVATQWSLAGSCLIGGVLLLVAAGRRTFPGLFVVMCLYALAFAPTLSLTNSLMFTHLKDPAKEAFGVMVWGVVSWVLVGWALALWRRLKGTGEGADCLVLAGILSLVLGVFCFFLPHTPPRGSPEQALPFVKAVGMLKDHNTLVFFLVSFVTASQLQYYYLGTAPYLGHLGVEGRNVPAVMTLAQVAQVLAMAFMAFCGARVLGVLGFRWAMALGLCLWAAMFGAYAAMRPKWLVILSQSLHGAAYTLFINVGFVFIDNAAPKDIRNSAQSLYTVALFGFGCLLGTQLTGLVMDALKTAEGRFRWRPIFLVPGVLVLCCAAALAAFFRG